MVSIGSGIIFNSLKISYERGEYLFGVCGIAKELLLPLRAGGFGERIEAVGLLLHEK